MGGCSRKNYGFYPYHPLRRAWEIFIFILSMAVVFEIPFEWCFNTHKELWSIIVALVIDAAFFADIFIVQRTGVLKDGVIKLDHESISKSIPKWRLVIYWLSWWPVYLIGIAVNSDLVYNILIFFKCLRFVRLYDAQKVIRNTLVYINPFMRMFVSFMFLLLIVHYSACVFWYTGHSEIPETSWITESDLAEKPLVLQYFHTVYYITTTVLTIGYGDLHPYTFPEICVVIFVEIIGVFFYNFLLSNMVSIVADFSRNTFVNKYQRIYAAFKARGVSDESLDELVRYYEYVWEKDRDRADFYEVASKMPAGLQKRLALSLHANVFDRVAGINEADEATLQEIAIALRPRILSPGDFLTRAGRVSSRMYFITEGKVNLLGPGGNVVNAIDGINGPVLGEASVIRGKEEVNSAVAETYVECFELTKEDYDEITELHPGIRANMVHAPLVLPTLNTEFTLD